MMKLVTDDELLVAEMSAYLTELDDIEPCANCEKVKETIRRRNKVEFCQETNFSAEEAEQEMKKCKHCIWYWIDEVEVIEEGEKNG